MRQVKDNRRGDTLIEVMLSISIFAAVALVSINLMNNGINTAQRTLETEMARNEIDAQAEALRYIHNGYVAERQKSAKEGQFRKIWLRLLQRANRPASITDNETKIESQGPGVSFDINNMDSCNDAYGAGKHTDIYKSFVINPRLIIPDNGKSAQFKFLGRAYNDTDNGILSSSIVYYNNVTANKIVVPSLYPRIIYGAIQMNNNTGKRNTDDANIDEYGEIYNDILRAEGIWIDAVGNNDWSVKRSDYYDFYIRTCWQAAGETVPSTITTAIRLYNPEVME